MARKYEIAVQRELNQLYLDLKNALEKGRAVHVEVKSVATKTQDQLGYYWAHILPRAQAKFREDGAIVSLSFINAFFNDLFFSNEHYFKRRVIKEVRSKSGASKDEMSEFLAQVIEWCVENGIEIQSPQEMGYAPKETAFDIPGLAKH